MSGRPERYQSHDLSIVVPTYKRPVKLRNLLASVASQSAPVGRMIIVDGSTEGEAVVQEFRNRIEILYLRCDPPGQIRQRNLALAQIQKRDRLVTLLDDDIVLLPDAVQEMIAMWNRVEPDTAGICFNLVNEPGLQSTWLTRVLGISSREPGQVLRSGQTTAIGHVKRDLRVQWLPGGATTWRRDILAARSHPVAASSRWAIGEDLLFSYPVGQRHPLYACAGARARHEHEADYGRPDQARFHGRTQTVWMYHFAASNATLSPALFVFTTAARMIAKFVARGVARGDRASREFAAGQARAIGEIVWSTLRRRPSHFLLEDRPA